MFLFLRQKSRSTLCQVTEPQRAYGHYVLSLYRLSRGDLGESFVELSCARRLYPRKEIYRLQEVRLREMISSSAARGEAAHGG